MQDTDKELQNKPDDQFSKRKSEGIENKGLQNLQEKCEQHHDKKTKLAGNNEFGLQAQSYDKLPKDIIKYIFKFLSVTNLSKMNEVSKLSNKIANEVIIEEITFVPFEQHVQDALKKIKDILQGLFDHLKEVTEDKERDYVWFEKISCELTKFAHQETAKLDIEDLLEETFYIVVGAYHLDIEIKLENQVKPNFKDFSSYLLRISDNLNYIDSIIKHLIKIADIYHNADLSNRYKRKIIT